MMLDLIASYNCTQLLHNKVQEQLELKKEHPQLFRLIPMVVLEQETMVLEQETIYLGVQMLEVETIHLGVQLLEVETHQSEEQNMLSQMGMEYHCCSSSAGCKFFLPLLYRKVQSCVLVS